MKRSATREGGVFISVVLAGVCPYAEGERADGRIMIGSASETPFTEVERNGFARWSKRSACRVRTRGMPPAMPVVMDSDIDIDGIITSIDEPGVMGMLVMGIPHGAWVYTSATSMRIVVWRYGEIESACLVLFDARQRV